MDLKVNRFVWHESKLGVYMPYLFILLLLVNIIYFLYQISA